jgi:PTH2 family peptidyl-tRNA hydrolase
MKPVQYIVANKGLGMSPGKLAAQVAHASVNAVFSLTGVESADWHGWQRTGHAKIVLEARDTEHLLLVERYLKDRGIATVLIIDEGRTEIAPHSPTALASGVVDKTDENVTMAFGDLKTYKEQPKEVMPYWALDGPPPQLTRWNYFWRAILGD